MNKRRDPLTKDLFTWEPPQVAIRYSDDVTGRGALENRIARLVGRALRDARDNGLTRADIAQSLSAFVGRSVSVSILEKWASEASGDNRIPLDAFIGLVHATGARELLGFVPGEFGLTVIEDEYAELIHEQLLDEHIAEMTARKQVFAAKRRAKR